MSGNISNRISAYTPLQPRSTKYKTGSILVLGEEEHTEEKVQTFHKNGFWFLHLSVYDGVSYLLG